MSARSLEIITKNWSQVKLVSVNGLAIITNYWCQVIAVSPDGLTMLASYWSQVKFMSADGLEMITKYWSQVKSVSADVLPVITIYWHSIQCNIFQSYDHILKMGGRSLIWSLSSSAVMTSTSAALKILPLHTSCIMSCSLRGPWPMSVFAFILQCNYAVGTRYTLESIPLTLSHAPNWWEILLGMHK